MGLMEGMGKVPSSLIVPAGACIAGCVIGGLIMKKASASKCPDKLPEKWVKVGQIRELVIYPVKTVLGSSVEEAIVARLGLKGTENPLLRDRVFAIVDAKGVTVSQKQSPKLALVQANIEGNQLHLSYVKDTSVDMKIDVPSSKDGSKVVSIFGEKLHAVDCGDKVASWLSRISELPGLRLVYHFVDDPQRTSVKRNSRFHTYRESHTGTFHDETSYMVMTDESVAAINAEIGKPVSQSNFRGSIIVNDIPEPFAEDFWGWIRIGGDDGPVMKTSRPCVRCKLTTVDPETGTFREDGEPLRTLYRLQRPVGDAKTTKLVSKVATLGAHFGLYSGEGKVIRVGDPIYAALV